MKIKLFIIFFVLSTTFTVAQTAKELIEQTIDATGGKQNFYNQKNVTYNIHYRTPPGENAIAFKGKETYAFDGELSHSIYEKHSITGASEEGYDGKEFWVKIGGKLSDDKQVNGVARFLRKTNYYWFSMFFKLLDDGLVYEKLADQKVNHIDYYRIKMTFKDGVGDAQDTYILYINQKTKLIDQFLFTITGFGITDPSLMSFDKWETINGIKIPTKRKYIKANWEGDILSKEYTYTDWTNIKFNIDIDTSLFKK